MIAVVAGMAAGLLLSGDGTNDPVADATARVAPAAAGMITLSPTASGAEINAPDPLYYECALSGVLRDGQGSPVAGRYVNLYFAPPDGMGALLGSYMTGVDGAFVRHVTGLVGTRDRYWAVFAGDADYAGSQSGDVEVGA